MIPRLRGGAWAALAALALMTSAVNTAGATSHGKAKAPEKFDAPPTGVTGLTNPEKEAVGEADLDRLATHFGMTSAPIEDFKLPSGQGLPRGSLPPERHLHLAEHRRCDGTMVPRFQRLARSPVQPAEPDVTVRHERTHPARLGQCQRLTVVSLAAFRVGSVRMGHDLAEQVPRMRRESVVTRSGCDRAVGEAPGLAESAESQACATERVIRLAVMGDDPSGRFTLEELFAFS